MSASTLPANARRLSTTQDIGAPSKPSRRLERTTSTSCQVPESGRLKTQASSNSPAPSPEDPWQNHLLEVLGKIREGLVAEKISQSDLVSPSPSKKKVISVHLPEELRQEEARRLFGVLSNVDSVRSTGGKTYNYEEKYPEDAPGEEVGDDARVFKVYNDEAEKYDADMIRGFRDSLDGLLVFASLFSAVVTTILMQTIQVLPTDQARIANYLLYENNLLLRANGNGTIINTIIQSPYGPDSNTFGTNDVWVNALFIASLVLSLTTALLSVLAKQWLQAYTTVTSGSARDVALIRHLRFAGLERWRMHEIIGTLPLILHISLALFFTGLFVFIRTLYPPLGWIVISISGFTFLVYAGTVILPTFSLDCPYRLPLFYRSLEKAERSAVAENSKSRHSNPVPSISWLSQLSSNPTVRHITAWSIASKNAWRPGIWDLLNPDTSNMLFELVWTVTEQNTVSVRALGQLVASAKKNVHDQASMSSPHKHAVEAHAVWMSKLARELFRAIELKRVSWLYEIVRTCGASANTLLNGESPLHAAVREGNLDIVNLLVIQGRANVDWVQTHGEYGSALVAALCLGEFEIVKFLVEKAKANVDLALAHGNYGSALAAAVCLGELDIVKFLVKQGGANVDLVLTHGDYGSALAAAVIKGELEIVKFLVIEGEANVDLALTHGSYGSVLAAAAYSGQLDIVKFFVLEGKANVNLVMTHGDYGSALAAATIKGESEIVKFLVLEGKGNVDLALTHGSYGSVLEAAAYTGRLGIVKFLALEGKADVNLAMTHGDYGSVLAAAVTGGELEIVKLLVEKAKANVNLVLTHGNFGSALAAAAYTGRVDIVKFLVLQGKAIVELPLSRGYLFALDAAVEGQKGDPDGRNHAEIIQFLNTIRTEPTNTNDTF